MRRTGSSWPTLTRDSTWVKTVDNGFDRESITITVARPRFYLQPGSIDSAILFWLNYKSTYEYWLQQRQQFSSFFKWSANKWGESFVAKRWQTEQTAQWAQWSDQQLFALLTESDWTWTGIAVVAHDQEDNIQDEYWLSCHKLERDVHLCLLVGLRGQQGTIQWFLFVICREF